MQAKHLFLPLFFLIPFIIQAQINDDFSDGDFTQNPAWFGDTVNFKINDNQQLQLNSEGSDTSIVFTPNSLSSENEWNIWLKMSFAPSINNNLRIYLVADVADLKGPVNGYFLLLGENGSDDSIDLFRQDGNTHTKIIDGVDTHCSATSNTIRIKVIREATGLWKVFSDINGGFNFSSEGQVTDNTHTSTNFFGLYCKYTSSNASKFYFDDIYSGPVQVDTEAPVLESFFVLSNHEIGLTFSEAILQSSAVNSLNFNIDNQIGNPSSISFEPTIPSELIVSFGNYFYSGSFYHLSISNIEDMNGNTMADTLVSFNWFEVSAYDVVVNEIMSDPNPVVALPEEEYIELFNSTDFEISLNGWILDIGEVEKTIPDCILPANDYLLLCATGSVSELEPYGQVIGVPAFQGLTNAGQTIRIKTADGLLVDEVSYSETWYQHEEKDNGGWSLERIDPENICGQMNNWRASIDLSGGTPGTQNSLFADNPDNLAPEVIAFHVSDSVSILIGFSEELDPVSATNPSAYQISETYNYPSSVSLLDFSLIELTFADVFPEGQESILKINGIGDVCSNVLVDTNLSFTFYRPRQWDIIINEIMADPTPTVELPDVEYVELLNTSSFPINLDGWTFMAGTKSKELLQQSILPGEFLILCPTDKCMYFGSFINCMDVLGSSDLTNDGNTLSVLDREGRLVSAVEYSLDWYGDDYKSEGGWSLERIDPANFCEGILNWSASEHSTGGTPGNHNSILTNNTDDIEPSILRVYPLSNNQLKVVFSEILDSLSLLDPANYSLDKGLGNPILVDPVDPLFQAVELEYADTFIQNQIYTLAINSVNDCAQNSSGEMAVQFGLPSKAESQDVVINEVLFNPIGNGADYVELFNRSNKIVDVSELIIAGWDEEEQLPTSHKNLSEEPFLLFPGSYLVLTPSKENILEQFYEADEFAFINPEISLPTMANEAGRIILMDKSLNTIDDFEYHEDMQFELLTSFEGIALERINFDLPTNDAGNWHSASETVGFGTPGLPNSQYKEIADMDSKLSLSPEIFSPDNDGFDDVLTISYSFDKVGYVATITVFDAKGRQIRRIADHVLLASTGQFTWDGITAGNKKARMGIYLILFEYFDLNGNVHQEKLTCVLAAKLE